MSQKLFLGDARKDHGLVEKKEVESFKDFGTKFLTKPRIGTKAEFFITPGDSYSITAGPGTYKRNDASQDSAWLLAFDGDKPAEGKKNCTPIKQVHEALKTLNINHVIHTTHSHVPGKHEAWHLFVPCYTKNPNQYKDTIKRLYAKLVEQGCGDTAFTPNSGNWVSVYYLPTLKDKASYFEHYEFYDGKIFETVNVSETSSEDKKSPSGEPESNGRSVESMVKIIMAGVKETGLHDATKDLAYGLIQDGVNPGYAKGVLRGIMSGYKEKDIPNTRQYENWNKVDGVVDSAYKKFKDEEVVYGIEEGKGNTHPYTNYPDQGGMMQRFIEYCVKWQHLPDKDLATITCHGIISTLGGRVYTFKDFGIVLTALVTVPTAGGKGQIKKFCKHILHSKSLMINGEPVPLDRSRGFIGAMDHTSAKNIQRDIAEKGSVLSIKTESAMRKSRAGDRDRVAQMEYELATEHGRGNTIEAIGQNEKVETMFSPGFTSISESVPDSQRDLDIEISADSSGLSGRRSHVIMKIDSEYENMNREFDIPDDIMQMINTIFMKADDPARAKINEPLDPDLWVDIRIDDRGWYAKKSRYWTDLKNRFNRQGDLFSSSFFGRMGLKVLAWAGRLAICDDPLKPVVTLEHLQIAEASLMNEIKAYKEQIATGMFDKPLAKVAKTIESLFTGSLLESRNKKTFVNGITKGKTNKPALEKAETILKAGYLPTASISRALHRDADFRKARDENKNLWWLLESDLKAIGIYKKSSKYMEEKYNYSGEAFYKARVKA